MLDKIPAHARIPVVQEGKAQTKQAVREAYERLRPLESLRVEKRGWTLELSENSSVARGTIPNALIPAM